MTTDFNGFGLPAKLAQALTRMQFTTPTPIQMQAIPMAMEGRDVLGSAQTGTGKTGAFGIPIIAKLMERPESAALIMTPTRELASQVMAALIPMIPTPDIKTALLIGGEAMPRQFRQLQNRPRLIVGTPGRINDHLERGTLKLGNARFLVLDETDRMLDMGFGIQIEKIIRQMPEDRQTMMFSATLPSNIVKLSGKYLKNPERIAAGSNNTPIAKIDQELVHTSDGEKYTHLLEQIKKREGSIIIFVKTKYGTERLADKLNRADHKADAIHGDLQQRRRERVIQSFRDKKYRILVATDVAARGLDIPHIAHVINYDLPQAPEDYIHRIGRTARAGAEGAAVNLITPADNAKWRAIHRLINGTVLPGGEAGGNGGGGRSQGGGNRSHGGGRRDGGGYRGRNDNANRGERRPYGERTERPERAAERPERTERTERPAREERASHRAEGHRGEGHRAEGHRQDGPRTDAPRQGGHRADAANRNAPTAGPAKRKPFWKNRQRNKAVG